MSAAIQTAVPIPPRGARGATHPNRKWPWVTMQIGDSFFAPGYRNGQTCKGSGPVMTTTQAMKQVPGSHWLVRTVVEDGVRGVRVWRLK